MKKSKKSIRLTVAYILILAVAFVVLLFVAPVAAFWYCDLAGKGETAAKVLIAVFYICAPAAAVVIYSSLNMLKNMMKGEFFTQSNTKYLSRMSLSCLFVVPVCVGGCFWFYGFVPIAVSAGFMFLILRIIKNVFEYGCEIKEENDLVV